MKKIFYILVLFPIFIFGQLKAYPSAVGYGQFATGGRNASSTVVKVTNLNASGAGSLKAAIDMVGPRYIVFDVGGQIDLGETQLIITGTTGTQEGNVTIDFANAPAPIEIINGEMQIRDNNVIIRNMILRSNATGTSWDVLRLNATNDDVDLFDIIIDRSSFYYGQDETIDGSGTTGTNVVHDITFQRCLIAHASKGSLFGDWVNDATFAYNIIAFYFERHFYHNYPNTSYEHINNLYYDMDRYHNHTFGETGDILGEYSKINHTPFFTAYLYRHVLSDNAPTLTEDDSDLYYNDNVVENFTPTSGSIYNQSFIDINAASRRMTGNITTPFSSSLVFDRLTGTGDWGAGAYPWDRDDIDQQVIDHIVAGTGTRKGSVSFADDTDFVNATQTTRTGGVWDSLVAGIDDAWLTARGGTGSNVHTDDLDGDGYPLIEEYQFYLNGEGDGFSLGADDKIFRPPHVSLGTGKVKVYLGTTIIN